MHLRAAQKGFGFIRDTQSFATGGWGPDESFRVPGQWRFGRKPVTKSHASFETPCGAYGHFKVARYLMRITGDSTYGDSMEAILYNTILGAKPIQQDGTSFYYADYNNVATKFYHRDKWPCCSGTFPQITADYGISSYLSAPDGVYVNLYVPSRLRWTQHGTPCTLVQQTQYPYQAETTISLQMEKPVEFVVYLRVPAWAGPGTRLAVNGKASSVALRPGSFVAVRQTWKNGDRLEFSVDRPFRLAPVDPQHANDVALLQGPLALFAVDKLPPHLTRKDLLAAKQQSESTSLIPSSGGSVSMKPYAAISR